MDLTDQKSKKNILALNEYYLPGYKGGGSIRALANLVAHLKMDFEFSVVTSAYDLGENKAYDESAQKAVSDQEGYQIHYLHKGWPVFLFLWKCLSKSFDLLYLNSFFSPGYSILPVLMARFRMRSRLPIVLAPRGEFLSGALAIKSFKKRAYINFARIFGLYRDVLFHATTQEEAEAIRALGLGNSNIVVVSDLPPVSSFRSSPSLLKSDHRLKLVYVSRIDPNKNLYFALEQLRSVRTHVKFSIVGPVVDFAYWHRCRSIIDSLPSNISVNYLGSIPHEEIPKIFAENDCLFFPTLGENHGYVILEAFLAGCPVLISDRTPWRNLDSAGVGFDISLNDPVRFRSALEALAAMSPEEYEKLRERTRSYGESRLEASMEVAATKDMFLGAMR